MPHQHLLNIVLKRRGKKCVHKHFFPWQNGLLVTKAITKVLHIIYPYTSLSYKGMNVVHDFLGDIYKNIAATAGKFMRKVRRCTLQVRDIAGAVALLLHRELHIFAMTKGLQALTLTADSYSLDTCDSAKRKYERASKCLKW